MLIWSGAMFTSTLTTPSATNIKRKHMKLGILTMISVLLCTAAVCQNHGFSITVGRYPQTISSGSELRIPLIVTNKSDDLIYVSKANGGDQAELNYAIEVTDGNGQPAVRTKYGQDLINPNILHTASNLQYPLKPGESIEDLLIVTRIFDLSQPGTYTIQVQRDGIKSSPVHVTVK
jgi:hypothetical protein